jgi:protocatechuate 3,4-dioxygenase beta subunit
MQRQGDYRPRDRAIHPAAWFPDYKTTVTRAPRLPLLAMPPTLGETTGPLFGPDRIGPQDNDLLLNGRVDGDPIGERILVHGRVLDEEARPVPGVLIELWQANAAGRYRHVNDRFKAPLDPDFTGLGRTLSDAQGRFRFRTVKPGPYPWRNRVNDWRPAHIHLSIFGRAFLQRLVTQLYFEGDPWLRHCPIFGAVADAEARERLVARLDLDETVPFDLVAWRFDIVLRGRRQTPFESTPPGR